MEEHGRASETTPEASAHPVRRLHLRPMVLLLGGAALVAAAGLAGWEAGRASLRKPSAEATVLGADATAKAAPAEAARPAAESPAREEPKVAEDPTRVAEPQVPDIPTDLPGVPPTATDPIEASPASPDGSGDPVAFEETRVARQGTRIDSVALLQEQANPTLLAAGSLRDSWDGRPASIFRRSVADTLFVPPGRGESRGVTVVRDSSRGHLTQSSFWSYSPITPAGPGVLISRGGWYEPIGGGHFQRPHRRPRRR